MTPRAVDPGRSRIVLVGTPAYDDPGLPDTPVVANNLADLAEVLTDPELGGFDATRCTVAPARAGIAQIGDLLVDAAAEAEDLLLFYYSGHGLLGPLRRELYLSLAGTKPDRLAFTALPFDAVRDACLASRARSRVVILDSCFSGRAIGDTLAAVDETVLGQIQVAGTYTLTSSPANRTALILPGERHTAFTGRMLTLLRAGSAEAGSVLSLGDIYRHLHAQLSSEGLPLPQQRGTETADLLGLVRNRYRVEPVRRTAQMEPEVRVAAAQTDDETVGQTAAPFDFGDLFAPIAAGNAAGPEASSALGDLLDAFFKGDEASPPGAAAARRGADLETDVTLKFGEAVEGVTVPLRLSSDAPCGTCHGTGKLSANPCPWCGGSGLALAPRTLQVRIPAGIRDGQRIRLSGKGMPGEQGGPPGDLFVDVEVSPHAVFGRVGDDLTVTVPVTFPEAVLGAVIKVPTLGGQPVNLRLPAYSANGRVMRVTGRGVPRRDGTRGNLLVTFAVAVPDEELPQAAEEALRRYWPLGDFGPRPQLNPEFTPVDDDVAVTVEVSFPAMVFGTQISVPTPNGEPITLELSPRTPNGQVFLVHGQDLPRQMKTGDLLVTVKTVLPIQLPADAVAAVREYQAATLWHTPRDSLLTMPSS